MKWKNFLTVLFISRAKYILDLLTKAHMLECCSAKIPIVVKSPTSLENTELVYASNYHALVGSLQYLSYTWLDITQSVNKVYQSFQSPTMADFKAIKWIIRYLKGTIDYSLKYTSQSAFNPYTFSYSNWPCFWNAKKSTIGYYVYLSGKCILWVQTDNALYLNLGWTGVSLYGNKCYRTHLDLVHLIWDWFIIRWGQNSVQINLIKFQVNQFRKNVICTQPKPVI